MLFDYYYPGCVSIVANTKNEILDVHSVKQGRSAKYTRRNPGYDFTKSRTYRTQSIGKPQSAIGRVRVSVARMFPGYDHATIGAIAHQILKCARFVRLDIDNPNSHLAFSPDGVSSSDMKRRRSLTFAKFLRRKCASLFVGRLSLTDAQIENGQYGFQTVPGFPLQLKIVTGAEAYAVYADDEDGIESCMSGNSRKSDIVKHHFCENEDKLRLVIARSGKTLMIRAKLWANDDDTTHYLDRIYWETTGCLSTMRQESELREWIIAHLATLELSVSSVIDCTLTHEQGEPMPYFDRCQQFDRDGDAIRVWRRGEFSANNTDGTDDSLEDDRACCCCCDCRVDDDDCRCDDNGESYCESCYSDRFTYDEVSGEDICSDDAIEAIRIRRGRTESVYTHRDNCTELHDGQYALSDDVTELHDGQYALSDDVTELHDGQYALSDDVTELHDGQYALSDDVTELHDEFFLTSCFADTVQLEFVFAELN